LDVQPNCSACKTEKREGLAIFPANPSHSPMLNPHGAFLRTHQ
jgi:hypothetical protein